MCGARCCSSSARARAAPPLPQVYVNLLIPLPAAYNGAANSSCLSLCDSAACTSAFPDKGLSVAASKCNTRDYW